ncbi:MAG: NAD(P)-dependent oxidoreductase [Paracoccaceae bacterium]|nr:NAD(P)-dependent oxidoreductase [Paracoccaceae bacterium]MDG1371971.1 NAD(P)-dependent oxidoreductase [Paracoccaceae bacterium]
MKRLAALTGGTGFLGRHVIRELADQGWAVRILARTQPELPELSDVEIELTPGDLSDHDALKALAQGADAFIHIAGVVKAKNCNDFMRANKNGAERAARAWAQTTVGGRFLLISSMAARAPELSHYAASKHAGELAVAKALEGRDWRILRPGAIYGRFDQESLKVLQLSNAPVQLMLNAPAARVAMVDARDAARAIVATAQDQDIGAIHEISDAQLAGYRWDELAGIAAKALGKHARPVRLPAAVLKGIGGIGGAIAGITGGVEMLTPGKVREILHQDWSVQSPLPETLYQPLIPLEQGLREMAEASGLLSR